MKREKLTIYIVPSDCQLETLEGYVPEHVGGAISSKKELVVNKVDDGYSLVFLDKDIIGMRINLINSINKLFLANLPGVALDIYICYLYEPAGDKDYFWFNPTVASEVICLDNLFASMTDPNFSGYRYIRSISVIDVINDYQQWQAGSLSADDEEDEDDEDDDDDNDGSDTSYGETDTMLSLLNEAIKGSSADKGKPKSKKGRYASSKALRSAKNPKRAYRRHGVIIVKDKSVIKSDIKIIKGFLKDFIPGNAGWKKNLRNELAERWVHVYAITSKELKRLEKKHRKMRKSTSRPSIDTQRTLDLTRKIFNVPVDNWSNPNK